jgi:Mce-associated membrane protein
VAGLRRPNTPGSATTDHPELDTTETLAEPETENAYAPPVWREPDRRDPEPETVPADPELVVSEADTVEDLPAEDTALEDEEEAPRAPRPTGKRRAAGLTRPANLAKAEAEVGTLDAEEQLPPTNPTLVRAVVLGLAVLALTALAIWFRGEASSRTENADTNNRALTDTATTSEVTGQVRDALEKDLSYNYTDMDSTAKSVKDTIAGRASCEYDQLFGEVKKLAPEQKLVLSTRVREIGVARLEGNEAVLLVFVDQTTTRADQNQTTASGAQFNVHAQRQGDRWKITQFDMLNQQLANGKPAPSC